MLKLVEEARTNGEFSWAVWTYEVLKATFVVMAAVMAAVELPQTSEEFSTGWMVFSIAAITAGVRGFNNYRKNRDKGAQ